MGHSFDNACLWFEDDLSLYICRMLTMIIMVLIRCAAADNLDLPDTGFSRYRYSSVPDFYPGPTNATAHAGELAVLRCSVFNLGKKTVVWRRLESSFPLTSGLVTVVPDDRIQVSHVGYKNQWDLLIKHVREEDEGAYECQIASREKSQRRIVYLTVLDPALENPSIKITGHQYIEKGEPVHIECNATGDHYPPDEMDWFRDGFKLSSNQQDGIRITKQYSLSRRTFISNLNIDRARMADSGTYVCRASIKQIASTKIHILNGETYNIKRAGHKHDEDEYNMDQEEARGNFERSRREPHSSTSLEPSGAITSEFLGLDCERLTAFRLESAVEGE